MKTRFFFLLGLVLCFPLYWYAYLSQSPSLIFVIQPIVAYVLFILWGVLIGVQITKPSEKYFEFTVFAAMIASATKDSMNYYGGSTHQLEPSFPIVMAAISTCLFVASLWVFRKQVYWIAVNFLFGLIANTYLLTLAYKGL